MSDGASQLVTVFMGTPELAVPSLECLARRTRLREVITQPDRPAGRGRRLMAPPVKQAAERLGLPVWQPEGLRQADPSRLAGVDMVVVLAYGELLRQPWLDTPRLGCINLHASLLPRWRGASPLQAAIRAGDTETGVTVMRMVRALDAGPTYNQRRLPLSAEATLPWLHDAIAELSAQALDDFLRQHLYDEPQPQNPQLVTTCGKLQSGDGAVDWRAGWRAVDRQLRAYEPSPGCWTNLPDGSRLRLRAACPRPQQVLPAGDCALVDGEWLVGCGDGSLALKRVQPPGKPAMDAISYCNGHALPQRLGEAAQAGA
ncbi:MAG: methionyl-tRNA formyltransferase [Planctomycetota bacterium]|nr:MAG: methionyl-tRNA formyltransferase [Planctomycetota bacterium]